MKLTLKYWVVILAIAFGVFFVFFGSFMGSWLYLSEEQQAIADEFFFKLLPFPLVGSITLVLFISPLINFLFEYYINPIRRLAEEANLITSVNPNHRITIKGADEILRLANLLNEAAERNQTQDKYIQEIIQKVKKDLEKNKTEMESILNFIPCGVVACNLEGQILFFNNSAQMLLQYKLDELSDGLPSEKLIGVGRTIFEVIEEKFIFLSLDYLNVRVKQNYLNPVSNFLLTLKGEPYLRVNMSLILDTKQKEEDIGEEVKGEAAAEVQKTESNILGFILTIEEILHEIEADNRREILKQNLKNSMQPILVNILNAVTGIMNEPDLVVDNLNRHKKVIDDSTLAIKDQLDHFIDPETKEFQSPVKQVGLSTKDLLDVLSRNIQHNLEMDVHINVDNNLWLDVDKKVVIRAVMFFAEQLKENLMTHKINLSFDEVGPNGQLTIDWEAPPINTLILRDWENITHFAEEDDNPMSIKELIEQSKGTVWTQVDNTKQSTRIQIMIPQSIQKANWDIHFIQGHRPVYNEFDIFHQEGQKSEIDLISLRNLSFVVFDTETTGLDPSGGDEIISLGAVRILNEEILYDETLNQLVNPNRELSKSSIKIHGIRPERLIDKPSIEQVLPIFHKFAQDSVLVAHNAAFDMRFIQLKEQKTGLRFTQPILDTLLLSAVVHPNQELHNIEDITGRLGIVIEGRHTALGDAIVTAQILLKLIPLLEANGIFTLQDARKASAKTPFAKLKF